MISNLKTATRSQLYAEKTRLERIVNRTQDDNEYADASDALERITAELQDRSRKELEKLCKAA